MKVRMAVGRCCCAADEWIEPVINWHHASFRDSEPFISCAVTANDPVPVNTLTDRETFVFAQRDSCPGTPDGAGDGTFEHGFSIRCEGIAAATNARWLLTYSDALQPGNTAYVNTQVKVYYALAGYTSTHLAVSSLKPAGGQLASWAWQWGFNDPLGFEPTDGIWPIIDAMQQDLAYVPGLDFWLVFQPVNKMVLSAAVLANLQGMNDSRVGGQSSRFEYQT